ncbi:unnamed protein product [Fusarium venenatum]|uniref:SNF2 N-terminal domain-containing protein n=1 Tax=Fusarium venenatum TaxID=56646 RepID=A0A2L2TTZ4_9HYPO|nr:uncharacterized protein FVRRES_04068 [Fusarium venenatum]CEI67556.1 unnamed protein product [Fusarium venenatum]
MSYKTWSGSDLSLTRPTGFGTHVRSNSKLWIDSPQNGGGVSRALRSRIPFSNVDVFRQYILEPLHTRNGLGPTNPLQMLLQSICLRRTEKYLNLPVAHYERVTLSLHSEEQMLYDDIFRNSRSELDDHVSNLTKMDKKKATLRFTMISELRRICNRGTMIEPPKTLDDANMHTSCDYCNVAEKDSMAKLNGDAICPECHRPLSVSTPSFSNSRSQSAKPSPLGDRSPC